MGLKTKTKTLFFVLEGLETKTLVSRTTSLPIGLQLALGSVIGHSLCGLKPPKNLPVVGVILTVLNTVKLVTIKQQI